MVELWDGRAVRVEKNTGEVNVHYDDVKNWDIRCKKCGKDMMYSDSGWYCIPCDFPNAL